MMRERKIELRGAGILPSVCSFPEPQNRRPFLRQDKQDAGATGICRKRGNEI